MSMRLTGLLVPAFGLWALSGHTQSVLYDDVAVIVNANHAGSVQIGAYFMSARGIPANRLISVDAPTTPDISMDQFQAIALQVEAQLTQSGLLDSINYLVTTLGMPVRVTQGECFLDPLQSSCSSLDSELSLIASPYSASMGAAGWAPNPFFQSTARFSRASSGIFLVTRLAATTVPDVLELIDRSGPGQEVSPALNRLVVDINWPGINPFMTQALFTQLMSAAQPMVSAGWPVVTDSTAARLDSIDHVAAYLAINDATDSWQAQFDWAPGGLYIEFMGGTALAFESVGEYPGNSFAPKMISAGATVVRSNIGFSFSAEVAPTQHTLSTNFDTAFGFNAAEALHAGIAGLSWSHLLLCDPKTSIRHPNVVDAVEERIIDDRGIHPNPSTGLFFLPVRNCAYRSVTLMDSSGRSIALSPASQESRMVLDLSGRPSGLYVIRIADQCGTLSSHRLVVSE